MLPEKTIHFVNDTQLCDEQYVKDREDLGYKRGFEAGYEQCEKDGIDEEGWCDGHSKGIMDERAKVRAIYKDANDLKELEDRIREYLDITTSDKDWGIE